MLRRALQTNPRLYLKQRRNLSRCFSSGACETSLTPGPRRGDRVVVAMSGGVDSSVTARLLADKDYDLSAVFMRNWDTRDESGSDTGCEWEKDWEDVQRVCNQLGLPCEMIDLSREYWNKVFEPSLRLWETGETPNPDVWCNREVKFGALLDRIAATKDAKWLAMGHYAGIEWAQSSCSSRPRPRLVRAVDNLKDQTYYLSGVLESSLEKALFPLQHLRKDQVRELAAKFGLHTAQRSESMGICFVGEKRRFDDFLSQYLPPKPGPVVDLFTQEKLGTHQGLWRYTIGQAAKIPGMPTRMFVAGKDVSHNKVFVVPGSTHPALFSAGIRMRNFHWTWEDDVPPAVDTQEGFPARVQFRHRTADVPCAVRRGGDGGIRIDFAEPQLAVAPGQVAALYDEAGRWCLGSGEILETMK